jgi:hypothetical protein
VLTIGTIVVVVPLAILAVWIGASAALMPGCAGCHLTSTFGAETAAGPHAQVACGDCHGGTTIASRASFGANQVLGMYLPLMTPDPTLSSVSSARCSSCHEDDLAGVAESAGLRVKHSACAQFIECATCHSPTAHGAALGWPRSTSMELCFECHATSGGPLECDTCHTGRLPADRIKTGTFAVTHGPNYLTTHGMGKMTTCGACHEDSKCAGCHGAGVPHGARFVQQHAQAAALPGADCQGCHIGTFCSDCHTYEMPHPASFTPEHADIVARDGESGCATCHAPEDCVTCHVKHVHPTTLDQLRGLGVITGDGEAGD